MTINRNLFCKERQSSKVGEKIKGKKERMKGIKKRKNGQMVYI